MQNHNSFIAVSLAVSSVKSWSVAEQSILDKLGLVPPTTHDESEVLQHIDARMTTAFTQKTFSFMKLVRPKSIFLSEEEYLSLNASLCDMTGQPLGTVSAKQRVRQSQKLTSVGCVINSKGKPSSFILAAWDNLPGCRPIRTLYPGEVQFFIEADVEIRGLMNQKTILQLIGLHE